MGSDFGSNDPAKSIIIIPAFNEERTISDVVSEAGNYGRVIVVDDGSTDRTASLAESAGALVLRHRDNTHIRQAFIDGVREALSLRAPNILAMDAGKSHRAVDIPTLRSALAEADMVIGSRFVPGGQLVGQPVRRRFLSQAGSFIVRRATGMTIRDLTSGFRAFRSELLADLDTGGVFDRLQSRAFAYIFELNTAIHRGGYEIREVPITYTATGSSLTFPVILEALRVWRMLARSGHDNSAHNVEIVDHH